MPTTYVSLTTTPAPVTGLANGTNYAAQNIGGTIVKYGSYTSAPDADTPSGIANPNGDFVLQPQAGESIYLWVSPPGSTGDVVYDAIVE